MGFDRPYFGKTLRLLARLHGYGIGDFAVLNKTFDELEELGECKK